VTNLPVLVTGAAGLLGNAVRTQLEEQNIPVIPIDRVSKTETGSEVIRCDVTDIHRLHAVIMHEKLGGIVHCGAYSGPMLERDNPNAIVRVNIDGTANILELARLKQVPRFVFCSSTSAYGPTPNTMLTEDTPMVSATVYGASKVAGEHLVQAYNRQYGIEGVSLRISWVYGPRRTTDCMIRTMIEDSIQGKPTHFPFGADFYRQYIYVDDAAAALVAALYSPSLTQDAYNVTGGTYKTLFEVGRIVKRIFPDSNINFEPGPDPVDDIQGRFDISAAKRDFNYMPSYDLESGIRSYATWIKNNCYN
tara:strand:- start:3938 stop:4855 length:918 start_codon:yes stop_codon:yes gene_type:complete